ncbi:cell wall-binding repeat-containing protein [Candidatus Poriferisodalis sp.]|uniref:cell wall-binding repeat-containing protein n=1 Tax=Candidatus Poriferisodalis sp. TaxID=3101277 RepID=UPI003AF5A025
MMRMRPASGCRVVSLRRAATGLCVAVLVASVFVPAHPASAQSSSSGDVVVIANGWSAPDAGAAAPLAGRLDGVMLYASTESLGSATVNALGRLAPSRVVLVGGAAALSADVEAEVRRLVPDATVERLSGADRYDTAARAASVEPAVPQNRPVILANGWSPSDVGTAAPLAARLGGSVLYAAKNVLGRPAAAALEQFAPSQVILVGGTAALSGDIDTELSELLPDVPTQRFAGTDRIDSAARAALYGNAPTGRPVVIADGWSTPDVGVAAPLAAALGGSVLFSSEGAHESLSHALDQLVPSEVVLVGNSVLTDGLAEDLSRLPLDTPRTHITGADRIEIAAEAALLAHSRVLVSRYDPPSDPVEDRPSLRNIGRTTYDDEGNRVGPLQINGQPFDRSAFAGRDVLLWLWSPF